MQPSIAAACLTGSLSDNLRSTVEADPDAVERIERDPSPIEGERQGTPVGFTRFVRTSAPTPVSWRPIAARS